jgi:hypothetical protein
MLKTRDRQSAGGRDASTSTRAEGSRHRKTTDSLGRCPFDVLIAFQLLGSKPTGTAIFELAGDSYQGKNLARPPREVKLSLREG